MAASPTGSTSSSARPGSATTTSTRSQAAFAGEGAGNVVVAANFAISAVLLMRFAEIAAPFFDTAEIIELHHDGKIDAPSGTAARHRRAHRRRVVRLGAGPDHAGGRSRAPAAAPGPAGIRIHSVRMRGMVAHQEVIFGAAGQTLTLRQDSYDRASFMPGVLLACKRVAIAPRPHPRPGASARPLSAGPVQRRRFAHRLGVCHPHETHRLRGLSIHRPDPS